LNHVQVSIRTYEGERICECGETGEIYVTGPNVMKGYYRDEQLTQRTITRYGLKTGDLGYIDSEGFLYVLGRKDEMLIKAGVNIYPSEIENVISQCAIVEQVLVIGVKDDTGLGERIQALIVSKDKSQNN